MRRIAGLAISLLIIVLLWRHIDSGRILQAVRASNISWLSGGLLCVVPLTLVTAWRFSLLSRSDLPVASATRLILSASTLNLVLPSKMGDVAKAWVLRSRYGFEGELALAMVVLEKLIDLAALLFWGVLALLLIAHDARLWLTAAAVGFLLGLLLVLLSPLGLVASTVRWFASRLPARIGHPILGFGDQWAEMTRWFWSARWHSALVCFVSLVLWAGHLVQMWLFARALVPALPLVESMAYATLAIIAGLLPFTMAGIGTRDTAIVILYAAWLSPAQGAALGVLATTRYILPAIAGLPFLHDFWQRPADIKAERAP